MKVYPHLQEQSLIYTAKLEIIHQMLPFQTNHCNHFLVKNGKSHNLFDRLKPHMGNVKQIVYTYIRFTCSQHGYFVTMFEFLLKTAIQNT